MQIKVGQMVTNDDVYGRVEEIRKDDFGNTFALIGWGKNVGLYNNALINVVHLRILNW